MRAYLAFTKKELFELTKTYKLLLIVTVFLIFGFMNPVVAKFTQMGLIILVIIFSGLISNELSKGTLINMLTKGLSRKTVVLSKFTSSTLVWTLAYFLSALVTFLYSMLFWKDTQVENLLFSLTLVWVFGVFLISAIILGGILFKTSYGSMLFCGVIVGGLLILNIIPKVQDYNPIQLININMDILKGDVEISEVLKSLWITLGASVLFVISSILVFCKREF